ncbi:MULTISPECIES: nicotinamide riboside transporter PnuC [Providencia]|uniref:Nicotinamide riboside transporter PnuC n=3 Tax=Providencia alcalifaciens TaxID=126385 RepID=A0AAW9VFC2_9GAMM|nr:MULTISPECIES: nicotinamide riboside transporter PnuC [Providencia]ATG18179.1 nicotinamide riboside transporter PnuC [Providencia alcalifaciens]EEB44770.1 nicotinamide mononucleotide transporter PnuC [Providencia alcalifaciens DSM 30120]EKT65705.1 nicotinamide riboside transporter PnuC [Providencia alcalifaciens Dmel2]ETT05862.1 nicotinamide riboside transporter PnuC [Providencia alcalifaciens F90-2004]EUC94073.1 nicotinamide riboside transporter PnuC [Providencia alcalifaciens PAL-2]
MEFFSTANTLIQIPLWGSVYDLSYIEAVGTVAGLLCILLASFEKTINYLFGLINVTLFAVIFFQIQLYANLLLQVFFFGANIYGWYAWSRMSSAQEAELKIRWLSLPKALTTLVISILAIIFLTLNIDVVFGRLATWAVELLNLFGANLTLPILDPDAFPFWDSTMTVLSVVAMILMTRKYVENWLLWVVINVISVVIFFIQGVYAMSLEYLILLGIALNGSRLWIKSAKQNGSRALSRD